MGDVEESLEQLRVPARALELDERQVAGVVVFRGIDAEGRALLVKVHGRDAYDNQLLEKLWRFLWHRDGGPGLRLGRGDAADHEGLVTLLARTSGVQTHEVMATALIVFPIALSAS
jgi:hypothetical protein